jgi:hypothetical protein
MDQLVCIGLWVKYTKYCNRMTVIRNVSCVVLGDIINNTCNGMSDIENTFNTILLRQIFRVV